MDQTEMAALLTSSPVGRLATIGPNHRPHVVPIVFALDEDLIYTAVDQKPKRTKYLQRLRNIEANPAVTLLVDHYSEDWSELWWVRVDGIAEIHETGPVWERATACLADKYPQYRGFPPDGSALTISIERISGWSAS